MKNRDEIYQVLSEILVTLFEIEEDEISLDAHLYEDMDLDSIDAVDLVVKLREITGKKIEPEDFKQVRTVKDVVDAVEKLATS
ncbi:acyl carrier protein [Pseudocolwellia sp. HL-MZ19]|jgi:acyl carrier protein|uniref:acyl carrier protein n=1 Tax=unclassified Pseudocolwellia TaxID=2848178 RepID=UPI003CF61399